MSWIFLLLAGFAEVGWALGLKYTDGFTRPLPTALTIFGLVFSMAFLGLARPGRPVRATLWVLVPLLAVYGTWREYVRLPILTAFGTALLWSALVAAAAAGVWAWAGRRAGDAGSPAGA